MSKVLLIMRHELSATMRRISYIVFALAVPVLAVLGLVVLFVYQAASGDEQEVEETTAGVVDLTQGPDGGPRFTAFREQGDWTFEPVDSIDAGTQQLLSGELDRLYVIPPNFLETGVIQEVQKQQAGLGSLTDSGNDNNSPLGRFILNNLFVGAVGPDLAQRVLTPYSLAVIEIDESGNVVDEPLNGGKLLVFMALSILLVMSILTTSSYLLQGLNEEKENRIMEILLSSAKPEHLMMGKLFGLGSAGLIQILIWVASGIAVIFVLDATDNLPGSLPFASAVPALMVGALYFVLGYFLFGTLMAALGAVTTSQREAGQVTFIVTLPAVVPMWFISSIIQTPEGTLARVLSFIPFSAPAASLVRLGVDGMGALDLVISLGLLAAAVAGTMWLTVRLFRAYLLMYGQRPGLRQIVGTLRNS